jgi:hypothetical protein
LVKRCGFVRFKRKFRFFRVKWLIRNKWYQWYCRKWGYKWYCGFRRKLGNYGDRR